MKRNIFSTLLLGILVFWIPILLTTFAYKKLAPVFQVLGEPVKQLFPNNGFFEDLVDVFIFLILILFVSYAIGWIARKTVLKKCGEKVDEWLGRLFPAYAFRRNYLRNDGFLVQRHWRPVEVELENEVFRIAFLVEEKDENRCVVFMPHAPEVSTGEIVLVNRGRLRFLNVSFFETVKAIRAYGAGLSDLCGK